MKYRYFIPIFLAFIVFYSNNVIAQLVTDNVFLQGRFLEVAVSPNGSWGNSISAPAGYHCFPTAALITASYTDPIISGTPAVGHKMDFNFDYLRDGWIVGSGADTSFTGVGPVPWYGPYYLPGTPYDGWAMQVNGVMSSAWYTNAGFANMPGGTLTGTETGYSNSGGIISGTWSGTAGVGSVLQVTETNRVDTMASWDVVTVKFVNTSATAQPGVYYFVSADPDNDESDSGGDFATNNYIAYQGDYYNRHEVLAHPGSGAHPNCFSGLGTKDCRAEALIYTAWPPAFVAGNDLDLVYTNEATSMGTSYYTLGAYTPNQDIAYGLIFNLGNIPAGDSAILSFAWIFSDTSGIDSAFPAPQLVTNGVAVDSVDTVKGCEITGTSFGAQITHGTDKDWSWSTWTWAPAVGLSATTGVNVTINMLLLSGPTSYTITGTDTSAGSMDNCHTKTIYLYVIPCFYASNNGPICVYDTLTPKALGDSLGATYFWYGPGGYTAFTQDPIRTGMTLADTGLYYVVRTTGSIHDTVSTDVHLIPLPVVTATSNGPVCSGTTLSITALPDSVGETFQWTGPDGFTSVSEFPTIPAVITQYTGLYKVISNLNGCLDSGYLEIVIDSTPALPTVGNNSPLCSQRSPSLMFTSSDVTPGVSYSWSGPLGFTSTLQNPVIPSLSTSVSGTYTEVVTLAYDGMICTNTNSTVATIDSTPVLPVVASVPAVCSGTPLSLSATAIAGSAYSWVGPDNYSAVVQDPVISPAITANTGTYSVTATVSYPGKSCISDTATVYAVVDSTPNSPNATSNSPGTPTICQGDTLKLFSSDTTSPVTYFWSGPNSFTSRDQNPIITNVLPAAIGQYTVFATYDGISSCVSNIVISVSVTPTPSLSSSSNSPLCTGTDTLFLQAQSDPGATFNWSGPYVFGTTVQDPFRYPVIMEYGGVYQVNAYLNGCISLNVYDTVVVHQTPVSPWVKWVSYCQNYDAPQLQASGDSVLWYASDIGQNGTLTAPIPSTAVVGNTFYYATQTLAGCTSAIDSIQVSILPQTAVTVSRDTDLCPNDSVMLAAVDMDNIVYYHWSPSLYLRGDTAAASILVHPETNVTYTVVATNQYGCTDTARVNVNVLAAAVLYVGDSALLYPGQSYQITPQTNCTSFTWYPSTGLSGVDISNPVASPELSTKYIVYGATSWGCTAEDSINIYVTNQSVFAVPNAFTPGVAPNALFKIIVQGEAKLNSFIIFDRWGVKVFETSDINTGWDGTLNGTPQPQGVFIYQINAVSSSGQTFVKSGNVTLLR
jgi:gliding motility-associated-like protein